MRWRQISFIVLVLLGLLLGAVMAEGRVRASAAMQPLNLCGLIGKHFLPPDLGHDPRRPGTPINRRTLAGEYPT